MQGIVKHNFQYIITPARCNKCGRSCKCTQNEELSNNNKNENKGEKK